MKEDATIYERLSYIQTNLVAPKGQFNSFGKYKFRSCEDILNALKPFLKETECFLTSTDEVVLIGERYYVKAIARFGDGQDSNKDIITEAFAREGDNRKGFDESQLTGSTSSYARKYALNGLFCIDDTKDADTTHIKEEASSSDPLPADDASIAKKEVLAIIKSNFKTKPDYNAWCTKKAIKKPVKDMNEGEMSIMLDILNAEFGDKT